jgi:acetolactate synthase-1/2/3 large subunit
MPSQYDGVLIPKPWGMEWCAFDNGAAAIWILHIASKRRTSLHCHPHKRTRLIVLSGRVRVHAGLDMRDMGPLEQITIPVGQFHQTEAISTIDGYPSAEDGPWLMEIEEPSMKEDLVRADDEYGRAAKPYETYAVPYTGELLQVDTRPQHFMGNKIQLHADVPVGDVVMSLEPDLYLSITKDATVKLSHFVADYIASLGIGHVFGVSGGGNMHLVDSIGNNGGVKYVATHHEQAAAMAAESYGRINGLGCALVTTGPGGTNALTGVACAWIDSIPVLFISGQVTRDTMIGKTRVRQFGVQESNIVELVWPITKYAVCVTDERNILFELQKAVSIATHGRPGPVWVDIPLDIQSKRIDPNDLVRHHAVEADSNVFTRPMVDRALEMIRRAERPVMILGNGVRLAGAGAQARQLVTKLGIPVVTSWGAAELIDYDDPCFVGHMGIFGDRASNFAVQNADLLLVIGSRLSVPMIGYNFAQFARKAEIIMVDIDEAEIKKPSLKVALPIVVDAGAFIGVALSGPWDGPCHQPWRARCFQWRHKYPVAPATYQQDNGNINSFHFADALSIAAPEYAVVVLDQGTAFTCTMQTWRVKLGQRFCVSGGHAAMGYGLPGAIGAAYASGRPVICIAGDGAFQFNLQELQTIAHNRLPITIFVLNNGGYLTIKHMQLNHFQRHVGSEPGSGVSFPDLGKIAGAYGIAFRRLDSPKGLMDKLADTIAQPGPLICEIMMDPNQPLIPRLSSKKMPDGSIRSSALEDLFPFLPREEFNEQMIVPTVETLK